MRFSIEIPDELLSRNGAEFSSATTEGSATALYSASGALIGGAAPELSGAGGYVAEGLNGTSPLAVSGGAAESDGQSVRLAADAMDGGAAPG
jgi:hypothetical protein